MRVILKMLSDSQTIFSLIMLALVIMLSYVVYLPIKHIFSNETLTSYDTIGVSITIILNVILLIAVSLITYLLLKNSYDDAYYNITEEMRIEYNAKIIKVVTNFVDKLYKPNDIIIVYVSNNTYNIVKNYIYNKQVLFKIDEDRKDLEIGLHKKKDLITEPIKFFENV